jgi:hypothetical protein
VDPAVGNDFVDKIRGRNNFASTPAAAANWTSKTTAARQDKTWLSHLHQRNFTDDEDSYGKPAAGDDNARNPYIDLYK